MYLVSRNSHATATAYISFDFSLSFMTCFSARASMISIKSSISHQDAIQALLKNINKTDLKSYFQIVYALECRVSKKFDSK